MAKKEKPKRLTRAEKKAQRIEQKRLEEARLRSIQYEKKEAEKKKKSSLSAQATIPYREMSRDGICRVHERMYSKTIRFLDINYQLAQAEDKDSIFENWCEFLNYFDYTIHVQLSFINHHSNMTGFKEALRIDPQGDMFDDIRMGNTRRCCKISWKRATTG